MKTKNIQILISCLVLASFVLGAYLYPIMPERMASHWDASGSVNGYMPKLLGLFFMPVISTFSFWPSWSSPELIRSKRTLRSSERTSTFSSCCSSGSCSIFTCLPYSGTWATGSTSSSSWHRPSACSYFTPES